VIRPMKPILPLSFFIRKKVAIKIITIFCCSFLFFNTPSQSQCGAGYYQAVVNWDNLDFLHNQAGTWYNAVYAPFTTNPSVTNTMKQSQNFALGKNMLTIATTIAVGGAASAYGDVTTHTGETGAYGTGADVHFIKSGTAAVTITMTFLNEVQNVRFSVFDIDQEITFAPTATNAGGTAQNITLTKPAGAASAIPLNGNAALTTVTGTSPRANWATGGGSGTSYVNTSANGTINVDITGPVKTIVLTFSNDGNTNDFWLSDISACVSNTTDPNFATNYYAPYTQPYTGQPAYFLTNPDSTFRVYMVNPAIPEAHLLFTEPGLSGVALNSIAYDPVNHYMYYIMNGTSTKPGNKAVKRYDITTGTITTIIPDINTLGMPTFVQGVEAASAAFYDGALYLGVEGTDGSSFSTNTESIIWRIEFDGSGNAIRASQVYGVPSDDGGGQPSHDWGDFIIKNGVIETHASNVIFPAYGSLFNHITMTTNTTSASYTTYADTAGQLGQIWNGTIYRVDNRLALYNENGTTAAPSVMTFTSCSPTWNNKPVNDASCPFRPMQDFGDAPATYDPVALSVAAHQRACNNSTLYIGTSWGDEWNKNTSADASGDDEEDGIGTVTGMVSDGNAYNHVQDVTVFNNTGANVYLAGWLDYDDDGVFEASEIATATVPSSASPQTITLSWTGITVAIGTGDSFLRIRLSSTSLAAADATGWRADGEVEDYPVISNPSPLVIRLLDFTASLTKEKDVLLNWRAYADADAKGFEVQRSQDQVNWENIGWVDLNKSVFTADYSYTDQQPHQGRSYYRLKLVEKSGSSRYSAIRLIQIDQLLNKLKLYPNPANNSVTLSLNSTGNDPATLIIRSLSGQILYKKTILLTDGSNLHNIDLSRMSNGLYVVEVQTNDSRYLNKLTVSR
jgi:GEVED domain/Secretion system C-terminal sorting domain